MIVQKPSGSPQNRAVSVLSFISFASYSAAATAGSGPARAEETDDVPSSFLFFSIGSRSVIMAAPWIMAAMYDESRSIFSMQSAIFSGGEVSAVGPASSRLRLTQRSVWALRSESGW